jgi:hypothetical protein
MTRLYLADIVGGWDCEETPEAITALIRIAEAT